MSTENTHRDIRQALFTALDLITAREPIAGTCEGIWLSGARSWINAAVGDLINAERRAAEESARVEAARGVEA